MISLLKTPVRKYTALTKERGTANEAAVRAIDATTEWGDVSNRCK
jgi:hypothetical protein